MRDFADQPDQISATLLHGARCALGPRDSARRSLEIADGTITRLLYDGDTSSTAQSACIDLSGFLLMPGLINAHDHLQYGLHPRLGHPPYRNYIEWGEDIHATCVELIEKYKSIPRDVRLWWGGLRNLLCGVTTVCHHDPLWPELRKREFPIKVVQQYAWAHSLALGSDLPQAFFTRPDGSFFLAHACEGIDDLTREELFKLDKLGILTEDTVLVHGLAIDREGVALMQERKASLIVCPSSNHFLFAALPEMKHLGTIENVSLGNDSPLTAMGDLLDEVRFAIDRCHVFPDQIYRMVTEAPARVLRLGDGEGAIQPSGTADLIAVRDDGRDPEDRLCGLSIDGVEFVMVRGQVRLASNTVWKLLPAHIKNGLEPIRIQADIRWLRAPVKELLREAESVLGTGGVRLGGRSISIPDESMISRVTGLE